MDLNRKRTSQIFLLFLMIIAGIILGSIICALYPEWSIWKSPTFRQGMGLMENPGLNCIFTSVFWLAVIAVLGLSVTGIVISPLVLLMRGAALGMVLEQLYATEGLYALGKILILVMPYACISTFIMLFGAREAMRFSMQIAGLLCEKTAEHAFSIKLYIIRFLVLLGFLLILGLMQSMLLRYGNFF